MSSYDEWLKFVGADAPKVQIQALEDGQRGLFAAGDIFAGERILYLPSRALLSKERIRIEGSRILEMLQTGHTGEIDLCTTKEQRVSAMIEELHRLIQGGEDAVPSLVHMTAQSMQFEWRGDDAVALYLVACRKFTVATQHNTSSLQESEAAAAEPVDPLLAEIDAEAEPVLVQNVVAIAEEDGYHDGPIPESECEVLIVDVAVEEVTDSFSAFLPHVAMLPESFPTNPLYFAEEELSRMEGTNCYEFSKRMLAQMESDWMILSAILRAYLVMNDRQVQGTSDDAETIPWDPNEDFELYKWALSTIYSRSTDFFVNHEHKRVIAPLFDMMNHDFESKVTHGMDPKGNLSVFAGSDIPSGSEICLNYGSFPNEKLLLVYGFVIHPNPYDAVQIYAPIPPSDLMYSEKAHLLRTKCGVLDPNTPYSLRRNEPIPESLLSALRLVGAQSEEELIAARSSTEVFIGTLSPENEYNALLALRQALHTMARRLALNLISDENLHAASGINPIVNQRTMGGTRSGDPTTTLPSVTESPESSTRLKIASPNILNCKTLCQSEYLVLQSSLSELAVRLELLENPERDLTIQ